MADMKTLPFITIIIGLVVLILIIFTLLPTIADLTIGRNISNTLNDNVTGVVYTITTLLPLLYVLIPVFIGLGLLGVFGKSKRR